MVSIPSVSFVPLPPFSFYYYTPITTGCPHGFSYYLHTTVGVGLVWSGMVGLVWLFVATCCFTLVWLACLGAWVLRAFGVRAEKE